MKVVRALSLFGALLLLWPMTVSAEPFTAGAEREPLEPLEPEEAYEMEEPEEIEEDEERARGEAPRPGDVNEDLETDPQDEVRAGDAPEWEDEAGMPEEEELDAFE